MAETLPSGYVEPPEPRGGGWLRDAALMLLAAAAAIWAVYWAVGQATEWAVSQVPVEIEERFWRAIRPEQAAAVPADPALEARHALASGILQRFDVSGLRLPYAIEIMVTDDAEPNAYAMPGGRLMLTRGLFEAVDSENGLAFVIGHELGHFSNRDHLRGLGRKLVIWALAATLTGDPGVGGRLLGLGLDGIDLNYSRKQESAADAVGLTLLAEAYGHAGGATEFFERMAEKHPQSQWRALFSTHPGPVERVADIQSAIRRHGYEVRPTAPLRLPER